MLQKPILFSLAPRNTHLRSIDAYIAKKPKKLSTFFSSPGSNKTEVEKRVIEHYKDIFNRTGKGERTLQILAEQGIISKLPDWVSATKQPLRQRDREKPSRSVEMVMT